MCECLAGKFGIRFSTKPCLLNLVSSRHDLVGDETQDEAVNPRAFEKGWKFGGEMFAIVARQRGYSKGLCDSYQQK